MGLAQLLLQPVRHRCGRLRAVNTTNPGGPDAQAHGGLPIVEWLLRRFRDESQSKGKRLLDYIDVHYYNQANPYDLRPTNPSAELSVTDTTRSFSAKIK